MTKNEKEQLLQRFNSMMYAQSAHSHGLFLYEGKDVTPFGYSILEQIQNTRSQLKKFVNPMDGEDFCWRVKDNEKSYDFVSSDGVAHQLRLVTDTEKSAVNQYLDNQFICTYELSQTEGYELELEWFAELSLLKELQCLSNEVHPE